MKKNKKPSATSIIKKLRERLSISDDHIDSLDVKIFTLKKEIAFLYELFPKKYYRITFNAKDKTGNISKFEKVNISIHPKLAVTAMQSMYQQFELISIKLEAE